MPDEKTDELLTLEEVARYLKVSTWTIHRFIRQNRLPGYRLGHQWRFRKRLVDEWLERKSTDRSNSAEG